MNLYPNEPQDSSSTPRVSIVIPNWNTRHWLPGCLDSLHNQTYQDFKIILVDNASEDDSVVFVQENYPEIEILTFSKNRGFAPAVNAGIQHSHSEFIALLNVDTKAQPTWLENLVRVIETSPPEVGGVASKMLSMENPEMIDDAGNSLSWYGSARKRGNGEPASHYSVMEDVFSASGGATLYRRTFLELLDGFDESFVSYLEDVDLGLRGQVLGFRCIYVPTAVVLHHWGGARIPRPKYVYLSTRNRLTLLLKSIPTSLLLKHSMTLLYGQLYFLLVYKKPLYSIAAIFSFLMTLPQILRQRQIIQKQKSITNEQLELLISDELGEPTLKEIILKRRRDKI